jgi:hypothetical protein
MKKIITSMTFTFTSRATKYIEKHNQVLGSISNATRRRAPSPGQFRWCQDRMNHLAQHPGWRQISGAKDPPQRSRAGRKHDHRVMVGESRFLTIIGTCSSDGELRENKQHNVPAVLPPPSHPTPLDLEVALRAYLEGMLHAYLLPSSTPTCGVSWQEPATRAVTRCSSDAPMSRSP